MKLSTRPEDLPDATDLATALSTAAARLGHRPALTVLRSDRREEQGFVSLSRWAAKGAHLLEIDCFLGPGDRLAVAGPASWPLAVACYAAWWAGVTVVLESAPVAVVDERAPALAAPHVFAVGTGADGAPAGSAGGEPWTTAVQPFPDQPPDPRGDPDVLAFDAPGRLRLTQAELVEQARGLATGGPLGIHADSPPEIWIPAVVRPLVSGEATVIVDEVPRDAASDEGVTQWLSRRDGGDGAEDAVDGGSDSPAEGGE